MKKEKEEISLLCKFLASCEPVLARTLILGVSPTLNLMNVKLCMTVVLTELHPFIPVLLTLTFYSHSCIKQPKLKFVLLNKFVSSQV